MLIYLFTKNKEIIYLFLVLMALKDEDITKLIKITMKFYIVIFSTIVTFSFIGIIPDWTYYRGDVVRHSLGFNYSTIVMGFYLSIICMYFYVRRSKCKIIELIILEIINSMLYYYTDARLSFILITIILSTMLLNKIKILRQLFYNQYIQLVLKGICYLLPFFMLALVMFLTYLYSIQNEFGIMIDEALSNRLKYTADAFQTYPITPFGQAIKWQRMGRIWLY